METQAHMDIARSAGVTMVGNPNWPGTLAIGEPPDASFIVLKAPDGRYYELYNNAGAMAVRVITSPYGTHGRDPTIGSFGKSASSCIWARGLGSTPLYFVDGGVYKFFGVNAGGALTAVATAPVNPQMQGTSRWGGTSEATAGRVVIEAAAGTASGLVLQNPSEIPWVIWVDTSGTLRITDWATFRLGV